ncbi:MAG: F0F1 ATP synthase subunit delta [Candidatus Curtissbacteria bacterium]|nr:F0F1 ATP synthase subunit delta [Candidatus Curtissbacteria bacterium]
MKKNKMLQKSIKKLVDASFKNGRMVESQVGKSIKLLKSLPSLEAIQALSEFLKGIKRKEREHTLYIETVSPLTSGQVEKAKKIVGKKMLITKVLVSVKPEILGGFKLRVGDEIWDSSILGKINQVKEVIASGGSSQSN